MEKKHRLYSYHIKCMYSHSGQKDRVLFLEVSTSHLIPSLLGPDKDILRRPQEQNRPTIVYISARVSFAAVVEAMLKSHKEIGPGARAHQNEVVRNCGGRSHLHCVGLSSH